MKKEGYLNTVEAAAYVGLTDQYLRVLRSKRRVVSPSYSLIGSRVFYKQEDLDLWLEEQG